MICPSCQTDNLAGSDLCENCGMDLAGLDIRAWGVDPDDPSLAVPLSELPLKKPCMLDPDARISEAIEVMRRQHEGCVFVVDDKGGLLGVFSERDLTCRVAARFRSPDQTPLKDVMTPNPVALLTEDPLAWALHRMGVDGFRHLPVMDNGVIVGMLSARSVMLWLLEEH